MDISESSSFIAQNLINNRRAMIDCVSEDKQIKSGPKVLSINSDLHSEIFGDAELGAALKSPISNISKGCIKEFIANTKKFDTESCATSPNVFSRVGNKANLKCKKRKLDPYDTLNNSDSKFKKEEAENKLLKTPLSKHYAEGLLYETPQFICEENKHDSTISESHQLHEILLKQNFDEVNDDGSKSVITEIAQNELNSKFNKEKLKYSKVKSDLKLCIKENNSRTDVVEEVKFKSQDSTEKQPLENKKIEDNLCQLHTNVIHENTEPVSFCGKVPLEDNKINEMKTIFNSPEMEDLKQNSIITLEVIMSCKKCKIKESMSIDICQMLSKYCTEKLKGVLKSAIKYKDFWGREKLTAGDFNKGIFFCEEESLLNYPPMVVQKKRVKLLNAATYKLKSKDFIVPNPDILIYSDWPSHNDPLSKGVSQLPDELKTYFNLVTKALSSLNEELYSTVLIDLQTNQKILYLVPYFVTFLSSEMDKLQGDFSKLMVLLKAMHSLLSNPSLFFGHDYYLNTMTNSLLKCLLDPLDHFNHNWDYWLLRDIAANLLAQILKRSNSRKLWFQVIYNLESAFRNLEKPFISHYGAVVALNSIGVSAVLIVIPPYIDKYIEHLNSVKSTDFKNSHDACAVKGQLINSYHLLICHYLKYEFTEYHSDRFHDFSSQYYAGDYVKNVKVFPLLLRIPFAEYFGDALVQHFPLLSFLSCRGFKKQKIKSVIKNANAIKKILNSSSHANISYEKKGIELKVCKETHLCKVSTSEKSVNKLMPSVFDYVPFKKHAITFGKIRKKL